MLEHVTQHSPWVFYTLAVLCVLLVGISKAGFGGGVGVVATPVMALVVAPQTAAGILLPLLCACDIFSVIQYRRHCDKANLMRLLPGAVAGIALAATFLALQPDRASAEWIMNKAIGALALGFVLWQLGRNRWLRHAAETHEQPKRGWLWGTLSGAASMLAHQGGPPVTIFLLPQRLHRDLFLGTMIRLFAIVNFIKLVPYVALHMLSVENLRISAVLMPVVPFGVWLGVWMQRRLEQRRFEQFIYVILTLVAAQLLTGFNVIDWLGGAFRSH